MSANTTNPAQSEMLRRLWADPDWRAATVEAMRAAQRRRQERVRRVLALLEEQETKQDTE